MHLLANVMLMLCFSCCSCLVAIASQQDSPMARFNSPEEKAKRERKHAEIDKLTRKIARQVRENEQNWAFEGGSGGSSAPDKDNKSSVYVIERWKSNGDTVRVTDVLYDSIEDAQQSILFHVATRAVSPEKEEKITGIGNQALLLEYPNNSQLIFSKGTHFVSVMVKTTNRVKSTEIAKRFAKYYDQAISDMK